MFLRTCLLVSTFAATLTAQAGSPPARILSAREPFTGVWVDTAARPGEVFVRGETYRAHFSNAGVVYHPLLGSHVPKNFRFALRLDRASVGDTILAERADVSVRMEQHTAHYENGPLDERYECRPDAVEQSFVVAERFGEGDLVVRLAVDTDCRLVAGEPGEGLRFAADAHGEVRYGLAKAIDAAGHELVFAPRWHDGSIDLVVPASFVATAVFPVTIDPKISTTAVSTTAADEINPDIAYDATTQTWLVVYEEIVSAGDSDVKVRRYNASGGLVELSYAESSTDSTTRPRVANNGSVNQFMIVWEHHDSTIKASVRARAHAAASSAYSTTFTVASAIVPARLPSAITIGGTSVAGSDRYLLAWIDQRGSLFPTSRIVTNTISTGGVLGTERELENAACVGAPEVNRSANAADAWLVTWDVAPVTCYVNSDIYYSVLTGSGTQLQPRTLLHNQTGDDVRPSVAGDGKEFVVVWEQKQGLTSTDYDIMGALVRKNAVSGYPKVGSSVNLTQLEPSGVPIRIQGDAAIDYDGRRYAITYSETSGTTSIYGATLLVLGSTLRSRRGTNSCPRAPTRARPRGSRPKAAAVERRASSSRSINRSRRWRASGATSSKRSTKRARPRGAWSPRRPAVA